VDVSTGLYVRYLQRDVIPRWIADIDARIAAIWT
jgi:hypothetical protein